MDVVGDYMKHVRLFNGITGRVAVVAALLLAAVAPTFVATVASAAQATERSIALSSTSKSATNVSYEVKFKAAGGATAFVVDFCSNTPVIGQVCTAPAGFTSLSATTTTPGYTLGTNTANKVVVYKTVPFAAAENVTVVLNGITNPSSTASPLYARIVTYVNNDGADDYTSEVPGTHVDEGGVAISITDTVAVSGTVLEAMTFCVSGDEIEADCTATTPPVLTLGETVGSTIALVPGVISTGSIYTQISTNAATGAVVSLKSSAVNCGGLLRAGDPTACDIAPAQLTGVSETDATFGVMAAPAADTGDSPNGTLQAVAASGYNGTTYALNYTTGNTAGVTSTFGDKFLDTDGAPANNKNMMLTFGVSVTNNTPAGLYSTDLSMIATGKF